MAFSRRIKSRRALRLSREMPMGTVIFVISAATTCFGATIASLPDRIQFNRDIRPILSDNCYACHGPDKNKRKADLRVDTKEGIFSHIENRTTVVPGKLAESELFRRVTAEDPAERMPDPKSNKRLTPREIALLKKWIEQGAAWQGHWSYLKVTRPPVPQVQDAEFVRSPIDAFILQRLHDAGLQHAPQADRATLIRRLSFDLTGLPPTKQEVDGFVADPSADAYEKLVDRLLASPHFGERMAMFWLDLVRYADSVGYHSDNPMPVSPFRDYVIRSFNGNKPFDHFTLEQLGGDLMPSPTNDARVASTYNRLLQTTEEGGAQAKEYIAKYDADRVRNVSTVWLGSTMGCCQCHDHKFDPFSTKDFYSMASFFADIQEGAVGSRGPGTPVPDPRQEQQLKAIDESIAAAKKNLETPSPELAAGQAKWEEEIGAGQVQWTVLEPADAQVIGGESHLKNVGEGILLDYGKAAPRENYSISVKMDLPKAITGFRLEAMDDDRFPSRGPGISPNGNFVLSEFQVSANDASGKAMPVKLHNATADFSQDGFPVANAIDGKTDTGWAVMPAFGRPHTAVFEAVRPTRLAGSLTFLLEFQSIYPQHQIGKLRLSVTSDANPSRLALPPEVRTALAVPADKRTDHQKQVLAAQYRTIAPAAKAARDAVAKAEKEKADFLKTLPSTLLTTAGPPRTIRVLPRGNWMDDSGPIVTPAIPAFLGTLPVEGRRPNRLDLAEWLVSHDNPLTSRVAVNRFWKLFFGQGLSKDLGDLGAQGEWPTHPELMEWLAAEFATPANAADRPWDVKRMIRLMVTSGAYRQSSTPTAQEKEVDPYNRLYARQSRFRLDAEMVRDNALAVSGLLVDKIGGPSAKPYQPAGYWDALNFPTRTWMADKGENEYRRGIYTWWQRSFLHPSLLAFDAPSREEATCERNRSNIPQQALALLDDPTYVEASRVFAERIARNGGADPAARIRWAIGEALSRDARPREIQILTALFDKEAKEYAADKAAAQKLLSDGDHAAPKDLDPAELAAWTNVARAILNLHETITRM